MLLPTSRPVRAVLRPAAHAHAHPCAPISSRDAATAAECIVVAWSLPPALLMAIPYACRPQTT